jgi:hypothetical protein
VLSSLFLWVLSGEEKQEPLSISVLDSRSDGLWTRMKSDYPQDPLASVAELVRHIGWPDHDVSSSDFYRALPQSKGGLALQDHKDLCIGVEVESRAFIRGELHPEKRNGNASIGPSLKQVAILKLLFGNDVYHAFSLLSFRHESRFPVVQQIENGLEPLEAADGSRSRPELDMV